MLYEEKFNIKEILVQESGNFYDFEERDTSELDDYADLLAEVEVDYDFDENMDEFDEDFIKDEIYSFN